MPRPQTGTLPPMLLSLGIPYRGAERAELVAADALRQWGSKGGERGLPRGRAAVEQAAQGLGDVSAWAGACTLLSSPHWLGPRTYVRRGGYVRVCARACVARYTCVRTHFQRLYL